MFAPRNTETLFGLPPAGFFGKMDLSLHPSLSPPMQAPSVTSGLARLSKASPWPLEPFDFHTPTRVVFGPGSINRLGELARELGDTRVLLVTDPGLEAAGHPQRAEHSLREAGLEVFVFD